jgi:hypothetical protein
VRIGHAVEHQQKCRLLQARHQLIQGRLAERRGRRCTGDHALVIGSFGELVEGLAVDLLDRHPQLACLIEQWLETAIIALAVEQDPLDPTRPVL